MARSIFRNRFPDPDDLDRALNKTMIGIGEDAELIFQAHARHKTGRLARGIVAHWVGGQVLVTATARDPQTGFDYVAVTRFGHRVEFIEPRADRARASVLATGKRRKKGSQAALRFVLGGRVMYRRRVRGFKPEYDWRDRALPEVKVVSDRAIATLGQRIVTARF